ncbi:MAG TPA: cytochrome c oxidase subunit II [Caulobacteraceae bacterium]|jgi:cytochrome c oxidase subunit 2|nr:cytochrome c oxidase subunit II [Caulobacteraceae bacterium]
MTSQGAGEILGVALAPLVDARAAGLPMTYLVGHGARAYPVTALTWGLLAISVAVVVLIAILLLWGIVARRSKGPFGPTERDTLGSAEGGLSWIVGGVAVSSVALVASLIWTVIVVAEVAPPRNPALTISVTGNQWWWDVRYVNADPTQVFRTANEIHIPTGAPIRILLTSNDVIHNFWVPQLTGKTQTIPGRTNQTWLEADRPGRYRGQCTQFCGLQHAHMALYVVAQPPAQFEAWRKAQIEAAPAPTTSEAIEGAAIFLVKCAACHQVRGTDAGGQVAPDLTHLMSRETIAAGLEPNTPAGLSGWISNPQGLKPGTRMPTLYLSGAELTSVTDYLETLK